MPQVPGPGEFFPEAAEGEVFPQYPCLIPPGQGDAAAASKATTTPVPTSGPAGRMDRVASATEETLSPPKRSQRMATTAMPAPSRSAETFRSSQGRDRVPSWFRPAAGAIDQQGQGQGAQHPAGPRRR